MAMPLRGLVISGLRVDPPEICGSNASRPIWRDLDANSGWQQTFGFYLDERGRRRPGVHSNCRWLCRWLSATCAIKPVRSGAT